MSTAHTVKVPASRIARREKLPPSGVQGGELPFAARGGAAASRPQTEDVYAGIPSALDGDLLRSQLDLLEKVEW